MFSLSPLLILFISLFLLMAIKVPVAYALGASCIVYILQTGAPITIIPQRFVIFMNSYTFIAVPLFVMAGEIMSKGGIMKRIIKLCEVFIGHVSGGLAHVNVLTSMILAGMSGSAVSDATTTSLILVPEMEREGYPRAYAAAITGASSIIGPIIPPSVTMVLIGGINEISIGSLFLAGAIPGVLVGISLMTVIVIQSKRRHFPKRERRASFKEILNAFKDGWGTLIVPIIMIGGMVSGIVTPTEAALLGVIAALLVSFFVYKEIKWKDVLDAMYTSIKVSANVMIVVGFAGIFGWILTAENFAAGFGGVVLSISSNPLIVVSLFVAIMLFMGMFINVTPNVVMLSPVFFPIIRQLNINPVYFGVVMCVTLMIGQLSPPVGIVSFAVVDAANVKLGQYLKELFPFLIVIAIALFLIVVFPPFSSWLPSLIFKN